MQSGMVSWMEVWSKFAVYPEQEPRREELAEGRERKRYECESQVPGIVRMQVADILAGMAWANVRN